MTIVSSATYDGFPSPDTPLDLTSLSSPITPTPTLSTTFPCPLPEPPQQLPYHAQPQFQSIPRGRDQAPIELASCDNVTIRPPILPPGLSALAALNPQSHQPPLSPLHYLHLARKQPTGVTAGTPLGLPQAVARTKRVRSHAAMLPLKAQREMTVRPSMYKGRGGGRSAAGGRKMQREAGGMGQDVGGAVGVDGRVTAVDRTLGLW